MKFACRRYFSSISAENDSSSSFLTTPALNCTNNVKKNTFFLLSVKDLVKLVKTVTIRDLRKSRKFTCYFSRKKRFYATPAISVA